MSLPSGVYNILYNVVGKPNIAALGNEGVDLITSGSGSNQKWFIRPISGTQSNTYIIQNVFTGAYVVPAGSGDKLDYDVKPYAWFITGGTTQAKISNSSSLYWNPNFSNTFVILASTTTPTWTITPTA